MTQYVCLTKVIEFGTQEKKNRNEINENNMNRVNPCF